MKKDNGKDLQMENELLKAKLTAEFGMKESNSQLEPEVENEWLNYIYEWETQFAKHQTIKVYDFIGKPVFRKFSELHPDEVSNELKRITKIMSQNNLRLDCICNYTEDLIYKFITEELFEEEIDDIRIKGMNTCFIYEEFHPNHEYDILGVSEEIINKLFSNDNLHVMFFEQCFEETIVYNQKEFSRADFSKMLYEIQASLFNAQMKEIKFDSMEFHIETKNARAAGIINYILDESDLIALFEFRLTYNDFYWSVKEFRLNESKEEQ